MEEKAKHYDRSATKKKFFYGNKKLFVDCLNDYLYKQTLSDKQFATIFFDLYSQVLKDFTKVDSELATETPQSVRVREINDNFFRAISHIWSECSLFMKSSDYTTDSFQDTIKLMAEFIKYSC